MTDLIKFKGIDYQIVYVDTSAVGANTGLTITDALTAFPPCASISGNSLYLLRRTNYIDILRGTCNNNNVILAGMPSTSAEYFFNDLPPIVQSTWGVDSISGTKVFLSGVANTPLKFGGAGSYGLYNLNLYLPNNQPQQGAAVYLYGPGATMYNCIVSVSGTPLIGTPSLTVLSPFSSVLYETGEGMTLDKCDLIAYGASNDYPNDPQSIACAAQVKDPAPNLNVGVNVSNTTFRTVNTIGPSYRVFGFYGRGSFYAANFKNLKFVNTSLNANLGGYMHFHVDTMVNSCVVDGITGSNLSRTATSPHAYGIHVDYGTNGSSDNDQYKHNSKHSFKNIRIDDGSNGQASFVGMYMGQRFTDCEFTNISLQSPRASNYQGQSCFSFGTYYNHHNKFSNLDINYGADLIDNPSNSTECYAFNLDQSNTFTTNKNFLKDSTIRACRVAINASSLDVQNCTVTGSVWTAGDSIELMNFEVNRNAYKYGTQQSALKIKNDGYPQYYVPSNCVMRVHNFTNNSGVVQNIDYNYGLISVEAASGGVAIVFTTPTDSYSGRVYVNKYPQEGYWYAANYWTRMESSGVQYVTTDDISSGFSLKTSSIVTPLTTFPIQSQVLTVSPEPYRGDTVVTSAVALGPHTVTLYIATKYATIPTSKEVWFDLEIPDGATGTKTKVVSSYGYKGIVEIDNDTTWYGEAPIVRYKITLPFILERNENCYSRIHWLKSLVIGTAFAYLSPRLVFR
jgi:hypothetical protein